MKPLLHPRTKLLLAQFIKHPAQALLLSGPSGIGKTYLADHIAKLLNLPIEVIEPEETKQAVGIEQIRRLHTKTRSALKKAYAVNDADTMSSEAQNAFLKLLEEPTKDTLFILTASQPEHLLATIRSRTRQLDIVPPTAQQLTEYFSNKLGTTELTQLLGSNEPLPGHLHSLLGEPEKLAEHQDIVKTAKQFYQASYGERLQIVSAKKYDTTWSIALLVVLAKIIASLLLRYGSSPQLKKLYRQTELVEEVSTLLQTTNVNAKIVLTKLTLEL